MKKPFIAFSIACACATGLFAGDVTRQDDTQWNEDWFKSIGTGATKADTKSTNGSWTFPTEGVTFENSKMVLDLDDDASVSFGIENAATESGTVVEVKANAVFYPILPADLQGASMTDAKVGFAVVKESEGCFYYGWAGSSWTKLEALDEVSDTTAPTDLLITLTYWGASPTAVFTVGGKTASIALTATANPTGVKIAGCGTVSAIDGNYGYSVAKIDDTKYATFAAAVAAAVTGNKVEVVRATTENVTVKTKGIEIADNGNASGIISTQGEDVTVDIKPTAEEFTTEDQSITVKGQSGTYTIPVTAGAGANIVLPWTNKEIVATPSETQNGTTITIRTKDSIVTAALEGKTIAVNDNFRAFLTANAKTPYEAADANEDDIGDALKGAGNNTLPLWQDYVLGIKPTDSVKPVTIPTGDIDTEKITLAIPAIDTTKYSGDYNITYKVDETTCTGPSAIKVPLTKTATYQMKIVLTPKDND